ncbi:DUF2063 domain-containing protein [Shewanella maritima]|uniref:HvfC family RiPP maturation protein n=1 Tax=Shewanella maritima TaxID=2520507 RepID=UPI003735B57D
MTLEKDFIVQQQIFMDYIKNPQNPLPEGIEPRRMRIYRELFFNNIDGFVSNAFPVLKSLYSDDDWQRLVQKFFEQHHCQTPIFIEIAGEFLQFLQQQYQPSDTDPVFMLELAHYEHLELLVAIAKQPDTEKSLASIGVTNNKLYISSAAKVAQYQFDVQHISVDYQPVEPPEQPQFFCVYRDEQEEVAFLQLNPLSAQVMAYIDSCADNGADYETLSQWLCELYPQMTMDVLQSGCIQLLSQLAEKGILVTR